MVSVGSSDLGRPLLRDEDSGKGDSLGEVNDEPGGSPPDPGPSLLPLGGRDPFFRLGPLLKQKGINTIGYYLFICTVSFVSLNYFS